MGVGRISLAPALDPLLKFAPVRDVDITHMKEQTLQQHGVKTLFSLYHSKGNNKVEC